MFAPNTAAVPTTPAAGNPVALVNVPDAGVPKTGVTRVGEVPNTATPEPVSLDKAAASCAEVNEPSTAALPVEVTCPVRFALAVTFPAVRPDAVPVRLVATPDAGVPRAGVTNVGEVNVLLVSVSVLVSVSIFDGVMMSDKLVIVYSPGSSGQVIVLGNPACAVTSLNACLYVVHSEDIVVSDNASQSVSANRLSLFFLAEAEDAASKSA